MKLIHRPAFEERYVDDGAIEIDELKHDHFESVAVFVRRMSTVRLCQKQMTQNDNLIRYDTIRYDRRCNFNVRSKADISQLNLPHGAKN